MFIVLSVLFSALTILLVANSKRSTPLPSTWMNLTALSAILSFIGQFLPKIATTWLMIAAIVWLITAIVVVRARFRLRKAKIAIVIMVIILTLLAIYAPRVIIPKTPLANAPAISQDKTVSAEEKAPEFLAKPENGAWDREQYLLGNIDLKKDNSTTGNGAFNLNGTRTKEDLITFLKSKSESSEALLNKIVTATGATKEQALNPKNWAAVQPIVNFNYPGNTEFRDGKINNTGSKSGKPGEIYLLFISPTDSSKGIGVRGACANPQTIIPSPKKPEPTPIVKKDPTKDPYPQGNAPVGGGKNADPGPGEFKTPTQMEQPPAKPRVNPEPPKPVLTPVPSAPSQPTTPPVMVQVPVGSTPDPTPAPKPEEKAPTPTNPSTGYTPPPGM